MKVLILQGPPASGKTTFAKKLIEKEPGKWKRVNRDAIREMLSEPFSRKLEDFVKKVRNSIIDLALKHNYNVIVDDTNLSEKNINQIKQIVKDRAEIEIENQFMNVDLDTLLNRNKEREEREQVPEHVIKEMYNKANK